MCFYKNEINITNNKKKKKNKELLNKSDFSGFINKSFFNNNRTKLATKAGLKAEQGKTKKLQT